MGIVSTATSGSTRRLIKHITRVQQRQQTSAFSAQQRTGGAVLNRAAGPIVKAAGTANARGLFTCAALRAW